MARHVHTLLVLVLAVLATTTPVHAIFHFDFRTDLVSPYDGGYSRHDVWRRAALASNARVAKQAASHAKALGNKDIAEADTADAVGGIEGHWMTVGIGTPPQPAKMVLDTSGALIWSQCKLFDGPKAKQVERLIDPAKSSTFVVVPCGDSLCKGAGQFTNCTDTKCMYSAMHANVVTEGVLSTDSFTFGAKNVSVPVGFGCGTLSGDGLAGASGIMSLSWSNLSLIAQLKIPRFSYCFTPFAEGKKSPLFFGTMANVQKYNTTAPIQKVPLIKNPWNDVYYYVPMVGMSFGAKKLDVPVECLALNPDGSGGTVIDSGSTLAYFVKPAFEELKKAVLEVVKLPLATNGSLPKGYELCFALPADTPMDKVEVPPLQLHFDGGAEMVFPRNNYFQEPVPGMMCLAVAETPMKFFPNMISNVMQQNMHVLFDIRNSKLFFAPTQCETL
jgi:hypothetical protein